MPVRSCNPTKYLLFLHALYSNRNNYNQKEAFLKNSIAMWIEKEKADSPGKKFEPIAEDHPLSKDRRDNILRLAIKNGIDGEELRTLIHSAYGK